MNTPSLESTLSALPPERGRRLAHGLARTPCEELLAQMWSCLLGVNEIGIYGDLTQQGATTADRLQMCRDLNLVFQSALTHEELRGSPTIELQAHYLAELLGGREIIEEIAWTFLQVQALSDSEVCARLAEFQA